MLTISADVHGVATAERDTAPSFAQEHSDTPPAAMYTVLVVDDDEDLRELVSHKLYTAGFEVLTAADGSEALETLHDDQRLDLVLMDIMMPGISGIEVCRQIRMNPRTSRLPVMLVTARTHPAFAQEGFAAGANGYMTKPFSPRALVDEVRGMLTGTY